MNIKSLAVPAFIAMSLLFTACDTGNQTIEAPDAVDGATQDGIEGVEEGANDTGDAIDGGLDSLENNAEDAGSAIEDGAKGLGKDLEGAAGSAKDGLEQGLDDTGNAVDDLGNEIPGTETEAQ